MASPGGELAAQLRHERLLDMEARLGGFRRRAFGVLALALIASGPWIGFWFLIPLAATRWSPRRSPTGSSARAATPTAGPPWAGASAA